MSHRAEFLEKVVSAASEDDESSRANEKQSMTQCKRSIGCGSYCRLRDQLFI